MFFSQSLYFLLVKSLAEFLPISSSGHLGLFQKYFLLAPLPFYDVIFNLSLIISFFIFFRKQLKFFITNLPQIFLASLPSLIAYLTFYYSLRTVFSAPWFLSIFFFINSLILFSTRKISQNTSKISFKQAFFIGVSQILTAFSGISRLGVTFAVGQAQGLSSESAFNFSLALFVPISFGALIFDSHHLNYSLVFTPYFFIALIFAILINILALKISQKLIISHKFWYFAFYTLILALILFFLP